MAPGLTPNRAVNDSMWSASPGPRGRSHWACSATVGQMPVSACTWPASLNLSSMVVAAAAWRNFPKRVPVFAKPHEGSSIRKASSAFETISTTSAPGVMIAVEYTKSTPDADDPVDAKARSSRGHDHHVERARSMDAANAGHLNIGRGGRAGNRRDEPPVGAADPRQSFRERVDDSLLRHDAEVVVRQQRQRAPALGIRVRQEDGAGKCDRDGAGRDHALEAFDLQG